jgi:hypothetical protein
MRSRTAVLGLVAAALIIPTTLPTSADARQATGDWQRVPSRWAAPRHAVSVVDVKVIDNVAFAVGNTRRLGKSRPWVQNCSTVRCRRIALPRPDGLSTAVTSISGAARGDMWASGTYRKGKLLRPVLWRKTGSQWAVYKSGIAVRSGAESLSLSQVEVANKSKAFALGRYNYLNGRTSTLYRWNGTDWKELAPRGDTTTFASPCDGWFRRNWSDLLVRSGSALLVGRCGGALKPTVLEQGDGTWELASGTNFPTTATWSKGAFIGQEAWLTGSRDGKRVIYKRVNNHWSKVASKGIRGRAVIGDLAGPFGDKVAAVGWVATGGGHREATAWRWGGGGWHETAVPAGVSRSKLVAVSVDGKSAFFAVGTDAGRRPSKRALILRAR